MKKWAGLMFFAAVACAPAQVTLSTVSGSTVAAAGQLYDFGSVALGSASSVLFRLTNTGPQGVYLTSLSIAGPSAPAPFTVVCAQSPDLCGSHPLQQLPILIGAGGTLNFSVQFLPVVLGSPSANMTIAVGNTISVILYGNGVPGLAVLLNNRPLAAGQTIGFGNVQVGSSQVAKITLTNQGAVAVNVPAIPALNNKIFSLSGTALYATTVAPGSSVELDVTFAPSATGTDQAALTIGLLTFPLTGVGIAGPRPVFPAASVQVHLATVASAQQGSIGVSLASVATTGGSGTVTLSFQPADRGSSDDRAIAFADGTRSASFQVAQGASAGQFAGKSTLAFATGTTAGTLAFTVTLGSQTIQSNVVIPAAQAGIDAAVAVRNVACDATELYCTATNVQLQINGWDNTRSASQLVFRFYNASGGAIAPGDITVDGASAFQQYFAGSNLGGVFGLNALFPITGKADDVTSAEVTIQNSAGTAKTARIDF